MGVFVSEFAAQRGMSVQGVYKAIKRHNIPTLKGVSNGKSAQFMTDEDAARLNELLGPTATETLVLKQNLTTDMFLAREALEKEYTKKKAELDKELKDEVNITRKEMLDHVKDGVSEMKKMLEDERKSTIKKLEKENEELKSKNEALSEQNQKLTNELTELREQLKYIQAHPLISAWDRKKEAKKNGKPAKDN